MPKVMRDVTLGTFCPMLAQVVDPLGRFGGPQIFGARYTGTQTCCILSLVGSLSLGAL